MNRRVVFFFVASALLDSCGGDSSVATPEPFAPDDLIAYAIRTSVCEGLPVGDEFVLYTFIAPMLDPGSRDWLEDVLACGRNVTDCHEFLACREVDTNRRCSIFDQADRSCIDSSTAQDCEELSNFEPSVGFASRVSCAQGHGENKKCAYDIDPLEFDPCASGACDVEGSVCEGGVNVNCSNGLETRQDCSLTGRVCVVGNFVSCALRDGACRSNPCHEGRFLEICSSEFPVADVDCSWLDAEFSCQSDLRGCGVAAVDRACEPGRSSCDGTVARVCFGGRWIDFDCGTFWDATCELSVDSGQALCVSGAWKAFLSVPAN